MRILFRAVVISTLMIAGFLPEPLTICAKERNTSRGKQMASVDGSVITETQVRTDGAEDLDSLELQMMHAKAVFAQNEHQILERSLNRLVEKKLISAEATKRGIPEEELLAKELQKNVQEPASEEISAFYESNKQRINRPMEEVAAQIGKYLKQQRESDAREAFLERLEKEHHVTRFLEPLRFDVNAAERPSLGPSSARVVLVVFSDFQCPYCKTFSATLKEVMKQYGDRVRLVFRQFPLTAIHKNAQKAAEASLCAAAQNRFWEMHDLLFQNQSSLGEKDLKSRAEKIGLDATAFDACLASSRYGAMVHEDIRAGTAAGADGTPTYFINGRYFNGVRPLEEIAAIIDEELKIKK